MAKGHDQGVADGLKTPENTGLFSRDGGVLRVVRDPGQTYGSIVAARVADLKAEGGRPGVRPIGAPGHKRR